MTAPPDELGPVLLRLVPSPRRAGVPPAAVRLRVLLKRLLRDAGYRNEYVGHACPMCGGGRYTPLMGGRGDGI